MAAFLLRSIFLLLAQHRNESFLKGRYEKFYFAPTFLVDLSPANFANLSWLGLLGVNRNSLNVG